jgi:hypothetical protein
MTEVTHPIEALEGLLCKNAVNNLKRYKKRTFFGVESTLAAATAMAEGDIDQAKRLRALLPALRQAMGEVVKPEEKRAWTRLWQLLLLRVGDSDKPGDLSFDAQALLDLLHEPDDDDLECTPTQAEEASLRARGWADGSQPWRAAHSRLVGFVNDFDSPSNDRFVETTLIFLANDQMRQILWLVAEKLDGPQGLITPHYWSLGLVPLGPNRELLQVIHRGFRQVLRERKAPCQLRWWLRTVPSGGGWHDQMGEAGSAEVSAVCLAMALTEPERRPEPLLDPNRGVSGTLSWDRKRKSDAQKVGGVGEREQKVRSAEAVGFPIALESGSIDDRDGRHPLLFPVTTVGDAYRSLLTTAEPLESWKKSEASKFIHIDDLETTSGKHIEVRTHRDFFVSQSDGDETSNLPDASELENDSRFEQAEPGVEYFMLRQTVWHAEAADSETLWNLAEREDEPSDEEERGGAGRHPENMSKSGGSGKWVRLGGETGRLVGREELVRHALSGSDAWQRVGVVCGAGLGKTTNFEWLASRINRLHKGRGRDLAFFLELNNLPSDPEKLLELILQQMKNVTDRKPHALLKFGVERLLVEGRVTFLADSLDQATQGDPIEALKALMTGRWAKCRVWISGRPYAFRNNRSKLAELATDWNFLRIGQLEEPECRQLLETFKRPSSPPAVPA